MKYRGTPKRKKPPQLESRGRLQTRAEILNNNMLHEDLATSRLLSERKYILDKEKDACDLHIEGPVSNSL